MGAAFRVFGSNMFQDILYTVVMSDFQLDELFQNGDFQFFFECYHSFFYY